MVRRKVEFPTLNQALLLTEAWVFYSLWGQWSWILSDFVEPFLVGFFAPVIEISSPRTTVVMFFLGIASALTFRGNTKERAIYFSLVPTPLVIDLLFMDLIAILVVDEVLIFFYAGGAVSLWIRSMIVRRLACRASRRTK